MRLSTNELRNRAAAFAQAHAGATYEKGETQTFYNEFFHIFGVERRQVARYEEHVKKLNNKSGFIDLFWPRVLLIEQKSAGRDLVKAAEQAGEYFDALKDSEKPRFQLVCDFQNFELLDRDTRKTDYFKLAELPNKIELFNFISGREQRVFKDQDPVNIQASELMGTIHDELEASGYKGHDLERFLVRLVFMLFADDTGIFEPRDILLDYILNRTQPDGSDTGSKLAELFQVLNTLETARNKNLDDDLNRFPHVNGDLFAEQLPFASFTSQMRETLIEACNFNWAKVSPAIFGSLFQSVMDAKERRKKGAHYTTEKNIMKVIGPLFLDELKVEFARLKDLKRGRTQGLEAFRQGLGKLTFLDPACGCGNFLIIAYRELRELELSVLRELNPQGQRDIGVEQISALDVDQFYGIEFEEFPARIAEVAMWMMDHIMNNQLSLEFGQTFIRIPLKKSPHIKHANALRFDWSELLAANKCSFILGNPPFIGHQQRDTAQKNDMHLVWGIDGQFNRLDYVACWFKRAMDYAAMNRRIRIAFVSTNSITQGEQCGILWPQIFAKGLSIFFAHRTFQWNSEARGTAAVHCVIVGLTHDTVLHPSIYEYERVRGEPIKSTVRSINGYLIDGPQYALPARGKPRAGLLKMFKGSQPTDGAKTKNPDGSYTITSNLIMDSLERAELLREDPNAVRWLRPFVGGDELISGEYRWCLWLKDADPSEIRSSKPILDRLERVKTGRMKSPTESVRAFAKYPTLFTQDRQPSVAYMAVPEVSSEAREYIPIAMLGSDIIASNKLQIIVGANLLYFGILNAALHMAWMRTVTGRLKSDYSYSPTVYNTFPWPEMSAEQEGKIAESAQGILDARAAWPNSTLADLYDPDLMPPNLRKAHQTLDLAVDRLYRKAPFASERERVEHLFGLYEKLVAPLEAAAKVKVTRAKKAK
jgi:N-6 DNA Methylase